MPSDIFLHRIQRFIQLFHGRPCSPSDQDNFTSYFWLKVLIPRIASGLNVKFAIFPVETFQDIYCRDFLHYHCGNKFEDK